MRRNLWIPDELWARVQLAAAQAGVDEGKPVPVAEWVRRAIERALHAQARRKRGPK